jgi:YHS domain-containing protein
MKTLFTLALLLLSTAAFANSPIETGTFNNKAIYGYDTVAYWKQNKAVKGSDDHVYTWRGAEWYFSSEENLNDFKNDPEKFAPQYGGYCAYAMSDDRLVGIDEDAFTIYKGKLYLNYSQSVSREWNKNKDQFIAEADGFYPNKVDLPE